MYVCNFFFSKESGGDGLSVFGCKCSAPIKLLLHIPAPASGVNKINSNQKEGSPSR